MSVLTAQEGQPLSSCRNSPSWASRVGSPARLEQKCAGALVRWCARLSRSCVYTLPMATTQQGKVHGGSLLEHPRDHCFGPGSSL